MASAPTAKIVRRPRSSPHAPCQCGCPWCKDDTNATKYISLPVVKDGDTTKVITCLKRIGCAPGGLDALVSIAKSRGCSRTPAGLRISLAHFFPADIKFGIRPSLKNKADFYAMTASMPRFRSRLELRDDVQIPPSLPHLSVRSVSSREVSAREVTAPSSAASAAAIAVSLAVSTPVVKAAAKAAATRDERASSLSSALRQAAADERMPPLERALEAEKKLAEEKEKNAKLVEELKRTEVEKKKISGASNLPFKRLITGPGYIEDIKIFTGNISMKGLSSRI